MQLQTCKKLGVSSICHLREHAVAVADKYKKYSLAGFCWVSQSSQQSLASELLLTSANILREVMAAFSVYMGFSLLLLFYKIIWGFYIFLKNWKKERIKTEVCIVYIGIVEKDSCENIDICVWMRK